MSEQYLIEHCSPTLAGIKTGSLFPVKIKKGSDIKEELRKLNGIIREKGLRAVLVRKRSNSVLVYVYRPDYLARDLKDPKALEILKEKNSAGCEVRKINPAIKELRDTNKSMLAILKQLDLSISNVILEDDDEL